MSIYKAPDGKKYNIPSEPNRRTQFVADIKEKYGEDLDQTTVLGQVGEFVKAIPRGAAGLALDVPTGIVGLFDIGNDSKLYKGLEGLQDQLRQDSVLAGDPAYADKFSTKLGEGIGSFGPFLGAGMVGRGLAKAPGAAKGFLSPTFTAPAALAIPTGIAAQGDRLQMARDMGEDVGGFTETTAELFGGLIGISEVLPIANILGKVSKNAPVSTKDYLMSALQSGAFEGGQEVAASILQDLTARGLYSDELPIGESMMEEFTIGGIIGAGADLIVSSMAGKKGARDKYIQEDELRSEEKKAQILNAKKAELATQQGTLEVIEESQEAILPPEIPIPVEVLPEPQIEIVQTPDNKFSVLDITIPENPIVLDTKDKQTDAAIARENLINSYDASVIKTNLDNATYNLGLNNSATAYEIGQNLIDTKAVKVSMPQLINSVLNKSKTETKLKKLVKDFTESTGKNSRSYPRMTMNEAKDLFTTKKEFNNFASNYARQVFAASEKKGEPSIIADKIEPNVTQKYIKQIAESKNIDLDFNSPAVQYAAEQYTGTADYKNMNKGQKELFLAKLHALPKFNSRTNFPDFRPRDYSAKDTADFVAQMKSNNMTFNKKSLKSFNRSEQFLDDLIYSGRAEKIGNTQDYKIRDNFEFDIARRAEGFNETPDEFAVRLKTENKLPPETIDQLIESEQVRQARLLPPVEVIPKGINYAESIELGKTSKFAKEVRKTMNARGLKETGIVVSNDILSTTTLVNVDGKIKFDPRQVRATKTEGAVEGEYDKNTDTIFLSLDAINPDGNATDVEIQQRLNKVLDHEMIHAFRAKDLITEKEYKYLTKVAKTAKVPGTKQTFYTRAISINKQTLEGRNVTKAFEEQFYTEEAIAELFRNKDGLVNTPVKVDGIFNKIVEFFKSMGTAMRSSGYKSAQEIFNDIESGKVGSRERGVVRSTRIGDKLTPAFSKTPRDESSGMAADYLPATKGPRASNLLEEVDGNGFSPKDIYKSPQFYIATPRNARTPEQRAIYKETIAFMEKLKQIKGNPNATITMYRASPTNDLRAGDLITPSKTEAQYYVNESKITQQEVRDAERARRRQDQIDNAGAINLQQEKNLNTMDSIMGIMGAPEQTPSELFTYELKAGDVRWDGNQLERWGYFPSDVVSIDGSIPTFSRIPTTESEQDALTEETDRIYFARERAQQRKDNLQSIMRFKQAELTEPNSSMTDASRSILDRQIAKIQKELVILNSGNVPLFFRSQRFNDGTNSQENIKLTKAMEQVEETVKQTPRGSIPFYNLNASDQALEIALDFNKDLSAKTPTDIPNFSRPDIDGLDENLQDFIVRTGGKYQPDLSWGARLIEVVKDPVTAIKNFFRDFRQNYIDKLDKSVQKILAGQDKQWYLGVDDKGNLRKNPKTKKPWTEEEAEIASEKVRFFNNTADTGVTAALRLADRARGLFQGMLTRGYVTDLIEGNSALANVKDLELRNGETGGLVQILAPLFANSELSLEKVFKSYAILKRAESFNNQGRVIETPVKAEDYALIQQIESQHPEVIEVYQNYQAWNNKLIDFAVAKGLLNKTRTKEELSRDISAISKEDVKILNELSYEELMQKVQKLNINLSIENKIETRGTAEIWQSDSAYYPFYKNMIEEGTIQGPSIAGGSLPSNPLGIRIEGSEEMIDVDPIEAISRNSLSILTAALKNDGTGKLLRDLQTMGEARLVTAKESGKLNTIFVFENGIKKHYEVDDVNLFHGIQGIGGVNTGTITKVLAIPAGLLRDTVTRDPGFVVINLLRDTLSTAVTSGAPMTPVVDTVKNMFRDMKDLEKFGVLGGYDFSNDEGSVKQFITRTMRQQGLSPSNGMSASGAFFKLWDGLGALTTKSDGATRLAVYEGVYEKLKNQGYTEAQAQSEAAYQALEIINFGRRGLDPMFKVITAAIPFLNARIQGLDVLYRGFTGQYSSVEKLQEGESLQDVQSRIMRRALLNGGLLTSLTLIYYMMVSDTDEYKNLKREVRDDNWVFPIGDGHAVKIPIPFEVGMIFKAIPERIFDMTLGEEAFTRKSVDEALTSSSRQLQTSLNIPFFQPGGGLQLLKPIAEVMNNRNTFTNTEIVPYYQQKKEAGLQSRASTNELARVMGEFFNISPSKIEHVMRGYTGTLGGYVLTAVDTITRGATGSPLLPSNFQLSKMPVINRLILDLDKSGGYQQQFYELRNEVEKAVQTINSLKKQKRFDELSAYRSNMQGVLNVKGQVRAVDRYLTNWRTRRDSLMNNDNISLTVKSDMLRDLELERDKRLAMIPELRDKANIPVISFNL